MNSQRTDDRAELAAAFLANAGWAGATLFPLPADASTRRYARLAHAGRTALLMDAPPAAETASCPLGADDATRTALGYNAQARLAGSRMEAFIGIADFLRQHGVRAPEVFAADAKGGFALIEDFGNYHLADAAATAADPSGLYLRALAVTERLTRIAEVPRHFGEWYVGAYDHLALLTEVRLLTDWYVPFVGHQLTDAAIATYADAWRDVLAHLSPPRVLVLRDFHAQNILVPDDGPLAVIDFQDGLIGQPAYDVVSLLEDARRDVDPAMAARLVDHMAGRLGDSHFYTDYAILAAQRNAKILGIFARLVRRDGKGAYAALLPRVERYFGTDLARAPLAPVCEWFAAHLPHVLHAKV